MALFYLVRHGESVWNAEERLCGRTDVELNDAGRRQAERLGERLRSLPLSAIYTSPLVRASETARIIADGTRLAPILEPRLVELNFGAWEGKTFREIMAEENDLFRRWDADPATVAPPGGETGLETIARVMPFLEELRQRHTGERERVVVVTHKTVCRLVACHVLGAPIAEYRRRLSMDNTALNVIAPAEDGWRLLLLNDTSHLSPLDSRAASLDGTF